MQHDSLSRTESIRRELKQISLWIIIIIIIIIIIAYIFIFYVGSVVAVSGEIYLYIRLSEKYIFYNDAYLYKHET